MDSDNKFLKTTQRCALCGIQNNVAISPEISSLYPRRRSLSAPWEIDIVCLRGSWSAGAAPRRDLKHTRQIPMESPGAGHETSLGRGMEG